MGYNVTGFDEWFTAFHASGQGLTRFEQRFLEWAEERDLVGDPPANPRLRRERVAFLFRACTAAVYARDNAARLAAADFEFWVYCAGSGRKCAEAHRQLDGIMLPPSHSFWFSWFPPNDWGCDCGVAGASSENFARRLGGDPAKRPQQATEGILRPPAFEAAGGPPLAAILVAVLDGTAF